jgi:hypothetical protein
MLTMCKEARMGLFLLYGLAAVWALHVLLLFMQRHKQWYLRRLKNEQARVQAEQDVLDAIELKQRELEQQAPLEKPSRAA